MFAGLLALTNTKLRLIDVTMVGSQLVGSDVTAAAFAEAPNQLGYTVLTIGL